MSLDFAAMVALRLLVFVAAFMMSLVVALSAVASLADDGRADALASFAPFTLCIAIAGAVFVWASFGLGPGALVVVGLNSVAAALSLAIVAPELARLRRVGRLDRPALRILSGNLYRLNPVGEDAVAAILARDADAVILQEAGRRLTRSLDRLSASYPHVAVCPHSNLMIYSRSPIVAHRCHCDEAQTPRGRLLTATISLADGGTVTLATTHFSHPYRGGVQALERGALAAALSGTGADHLILAGDFNTTPWSRAMRHQDRMLAPLRRWSIAWFTWPARLPYWRRDWPAPLLPIDHLYAGPEWDQVRLRRVRIPGSDHFATEATLGRSERAPPRER